mgnify:CR=1 FL=1
MKRNERGYTFVEILLVLGVFSIITTTAVYHAADMNEDGELTFADVLLFISSYVNG